MKTLLLGCCCVALLSCGPKPAGKFEGNEESVEVLPPEAHPDGQPATGAVTYLTSREAIAPTMLAQKVAIDAAADTDVTFTVPVDLSTQGVWARVWLPAGGWVELDGARQAPARGGLIFFSLESRVAHLRVERAQRVEFQIVASIDSAGGGFEVAPEEPLTVVVPAGGGTLSDLSHPANTADDSFLRLARVQLSADTDVHLTLGRCDNTTPVHAYDAVAGVPFSTTDLLLPGTLCTQSSAKVTLTLDVAGRVRRFSENSLRPVKAVTVLDTSSGVGRWLGAPLPGQRLDFDLHGITGFAPGAQALVRIDSTGPVKLGACDGASTTRSPGEAVLVANDASLCLETTTQAHVRLTLIAATTVRSQDTGVCHPPTALPACTDTTLLGRLKCIPGVIASQVQMTSLPPGASQYLLRIEQPVDHFRPDGPKFSQRVLLTVQDEAAPMVMMTTGYELFGYFSEITTAFATNQLEVEHRFFADSTPNPLDYSTLTIMQSAWDSHRIVEALRPLFPAPWLTTGASKGGMTALYHRRFFPCDVDASAPYVTPLSLGDQDPRYGPWLAQLGGQQWENCRLTFNELEQGVISRRAEFAPTLSGTYSMIGSKVNALWAITGQSYWSMFQSGTQSDPGQGCPAYEAYRGSPQFDQLVEQFASYGQGYSNETLLQYPLDAYSYQTQNELGSPGANRAHLVVYGPIPELPDIGALILGSVPRPDFEARAMTDVQWWLKTHGNHFLFVYGGFDPWTGGRVDTEGTQDALNYLVPGGSHGSGLDQLPLEQSDEAFARLSTWLGVQRVHKRAKAADGNPLPTYRDFMNRHPL